MIRTLLSIGALQASGILIMALRSKLFAVLLGPAGFGIVATIDQLVTSLAQLSNLSVPFTALKFLSSSHSVSEQAYRRSYTAFLRLMVVLAVLATATSIAVALLALEKLDPELARYQTAVLIAVMGVPALLLMMFFANALAARQESLRSVSLTVLYGAVLLVFGGIGCWLGGIQGIYLGAVPAAMLLIGSTWWLLRARLAPTPTEASIALWKELKSHHQILQTAIFTYVGVGSIACTMLLSRYVAITQLNPEAAGLFQACLAIAMAIGALLGPANSLYLSPQLNRTIPTSEKSSAVAQFVPRLTLLFCLAALPVLLFPEFALWALFSSQFKSAADLLVWFMIWQFVAQLVAVYHHFLIGLNDLRGFCAALAAGNAATVTGCFMWVDEFGLRGLGAAFIAGALLSLGLTLLRLRQKHAVTLPLDLMPLLTLVPMALIFLPMLPLGAEAEASGAGYRGLLMLGFVLALWHMLPKDLRQELNGGLRSYLIRRRKKSD